MPSSIQNPTPRRTTPNERHSEGGDAWVDRVADEVQALLREHGLELELCVFFDPIAEYLHAVGYDGSAARYFRSLESDRATSDSPAPRGNPMSENIQNPAPSPATNEEASQ